MPDHGIVVVGASAGGVEALADLTASLPGDLPAPLFVVLHLPATGTSALPEILRRQGPLPAAHVKDGEPIRPGRIYVAPPDHHILLRTGHVHLSRGPRENGHRPAIDPLFRSAAREYASKVIGVVLSGALDDGTAGLVAVKSCGGVAVVQGPSDALYPAMPGNALEHVQVDHVVAAASMGKLLARLLADLAEPCPGRPWAACRWRSRWRGSRPRPSRATTRAGPRGSRARTATACSGSSGRAASSGTAAGSAMPGRPRASSSSRARPSRRPCGSPCEASRSGARLPGGWPSRPAAAATRSRPAGSRSRRPRPSRRPGWSASCW